MSVDLQVNSTVPLYGSTVIMSDMHLCGPGDANAKMFLRMAHTLRRFDLEAVVFLGDIFDFYLGNHPYFKKKFSFWLEVSATLARRVIFLEGNHEFHCQNKQWPGIEVITAFDYRLSLQDGTDLQLTHGDLLVRDRGYRLLRLILKSKLSSVVGRRLPGRMLDRCSALVARLSRLRTRAQACDQVEVRHRAAAWIDRSPASIGIFGHFHFPCAYRSPQGKKVISLSSWDNPNILIYLAGKFYRGHCGGETEQLEITEVDI